VRLEWRDLSPVEVHQWYRPVDLCMMRANNSAMDTQSYYMTFCGGKNRLLARFCGPGMGNKGACPMPLASRTYFRRGLEGYTDVQRRPIRSLLGTLAQQRRELILIGDSLMRQTMDGLLCELSRENITSIVELANQMNTFSIDLGGAMVTNVSLIQLGKFDTAPKGQTPWAWKKDIESLLNSTRNNGALIAINAGVWYSSPEDGYNAHLANVLPWLNRLIKHYSTRESSVEGLQSSLSAVFFESYPQHWNTSTGHYVDYALSGFSNRSAIRSALPQPPGPGHCCHPLLLRHDWRNIRLHQLVRELHATHISVLPVAEAMEDAYMMHSCHMGKTLKNDCTHYCFWPLLMQYQWEALALVAASGCVGSKCRMPY
jgi:hypothetical protein